MLSRRVISVGLKWALSEVAFLIESLTSSRPTTEASPSPFDCVW